MVVKCVAMAVAMEHPKVKIIFIIPISSCLSIFNVIFSPEEYFAKFANT